MRLVHPSLAEQPAFLSFIDTLPERFDTSGKVIFSARNEIRLFEIEGVGTVAVKSYRRPRFVQRIVYSFFRTPKAQKAFRHAATIEERGLSTPRAYAALSTLKNGLFHRSFLVTAYAPWDDLYTAFLSEEEYDADVAVALGNFFAQLHAAGIAHHDLNCGNILYHKEGESISFSLIDINRMAFLDRPLNQAERIDNLVRLTWYDTAFLCVMQSYATACVLPSSFPRTALLAKKQFEEQWLRKKRWLAPLKRLFRCNK